MDSAVHGERRLSGNLEKVHKAVKNPSIGTGFDAVVGVGLDVVGGAAVGAGLGDAMAGATVDAASLVTNPSETAAGEPRSLVSPHISPATDRPASCGGHSYIYIWCCRRG